MNEPLGSTAVVNCFTSELLAQCRLPTKETFVLQTAIEARHGSNLKYHIVFITRHKDGVRLINEAFVKEKRDVYQQTADTETLSLFDENINPLQDAQRSIGAKNAILDVARTDPQRIWTLEHLIFTAINLYSGQYLEKDYKGAVRELLINTNAPRLVGVQGFRLMNGFWKVEDTLTLRLEE